MTTETNEGPLKAIEHACEIIERADARLLAGDGPVGNQPPDMTLAEWRELYVTLDAARKQPPSPVGDAPTEDGFDHSAKVDRETEARKRCPEHGLLCAGEMCCCKDLHGDAPALHTDPSYSTKAGESGIATPESVFPSLQVDGRGNIISPVSPVVEEEMPKHSTFDDLLNRFAVAYTDAAPSDDYYASTRAAIHAHLTATVQEAVLKERTRLYQYEPFVRVAANFIDVEGDESRADSEVSAKLRELQALLTPQGRQG